MWLSSFFSYLEAVKICLELVHMALMGLSWPLTSPMGVKLSTFHTFSMPPRQALSSMGRPGTYARAHTQSLWALGICCGEEGKGTENQTGREETHVIILYQKYHRILQVTGIGVIWLLHFKNSSKNLNVNDQGFIFMVYKSSSVSQHMPLKENAHCC